jgi:phosphatidylserine/phosphatidylglycerophosphate/cardiolipin synthase-like enzyme
MNQPSLADDFDAGVSASVWRYARATRAHVVVDAADYFDLMQDAMLEARQQILLIGWDFDTRIRLGEGRRWWNLPRRKTFPARLGAFVVWLVRRRRGLQVRVLKWNFGALKFVLRGTMIIDLIRWWRHDQIDFKFDSAHPLGCSHHQKIVVIDDKFAVCGGIDMTSDRWDTPAHVEHDSRRRKIGGGSYGPWHDVTMMIEGEAARALGDLGRSRWKTGGGEPIHACEPQDASPWPEQLEAEFSDVEIGISRTRAAYKNLPEVTEIEELFVEHIARAKSFIYAESQYFASRRIAEAIAVRMAEPDPPEVLLINPLTADGWLEQTAMDGARVQLLHAIGARDRRNRFRIYIPFAALGTPIYVHAKIMIVDDMILRIGSANMNNRSMGLDTECDVFIDAERPGNGHAVPAISRVRHRLLAEHCGIDCDKVASLLEQHGSMSAMIDALEMPGKRLAPFVLRPLTGAEKAVADNALLDPERPGELFEPIGKRRGLFKRGGILRRPR